MNQTNLNCDYLIITVYNKKMASGIMRGKQTYEQLKKKYKHVYNNEEFSSLIEKNPKTDLLNLKTVLFFFKWTTVGSGWGKKLKNPYIIWDIVDGLDQLRPFKNHGVEKDVIVTYENCKGYRDMYNRCDLINCANSKQMEILSADNPKKKTFACIPHNWDNRTRDTFSLSKRNEKLKEPVYVFVGTSQQQYDKKFKNFHKFKPIANKIVDSKLLGTFNVCGSFRTSEQSIPKPGTKCAVAASMNSIFIASKNEYGVVDLLGDDYPYYFDNPSTKNVKDVMNKIDNTYKTKTWDKAMECVNNARIKSDVVTTTNQFIDHFLKHFNK